MRETRGLRVGELARRLGISHCYLSNIESGRRRLTPPLAARAARVLRVRLLALIRADTLDGNGAGGRR
jgi:transcriptional regulator with XRE-family HTH domain